MVTNQFFKWNDPPDFPQPLNIQPRHTRPSKWPRDSGLAAYLGKTWFGGILSIRPLRLYRFGRIVLLLLLLLIIIIIIQLNILHGFVSYDHCSLRVLAAQSTMAQIKQSRLPKSWPMWLSGSGDDFPVWSIGVYDIFSTSKAFVDSSAFNPKHFGSWYQTMRTLPMSWRCSDSNWPRELGEVAYLSSTSSGVPKKSTIPKFFDPPPDLFKYKLNIVEPPKCCIFPSKTSTSPALKRPLKARTSEEARGQVLQVLEAKDRISKSSPRGCMARGSQLTLESLLQMDWKSENPGKIMEISWNHGKYHGSRGDSGFEMVLVSFVFGCPVA